MPPHSLRIQLRNISGQALLLHADSTTTVGALKRQVAGRWGVPALCQRLLLGTEALQDDAEVLASRLDSLDELLPVDELEGVEGADGLPAHLSMMLVVSLDEAHRHLCHDDWRVRREAVQAFVHAAPRANRGAVAAVVGLLGDPVPGVRVAVLQALSKIAAHGDGRIIGTVCGSLKDDCPSVRIASLHALASLTPAGSTVLEGIISAVCAIIADPEPSVREVVLANLPQMIPRGSEAVIAAIGAIGVLLKRERNVVARLAGLKALSALAMPGDERAIVLVSELTEDREPRVQLEAQSVLAYLVPNEFNRKLVTVLSRLRHGRTDAKIVALRNLSNLPLEDAGRKYAFRALGAILKDRDATLRLQALKALLNVAPFGGREALQALRPSLEAQRPELRRAALGVLVRWAHNCRGTDDEEDTFAMVSACLEHSDDQMREAARQALSYLVPNVEDRRAVVAQARLKHGHVERQQKALHELEGLAAAGNRRAVAIAAALLREEPSLVCAALEILARAAPTKDDALLKALVEKAAHESPQVRLLVLKVLGRLAGKGCKPALATACSRLADADEATQQEAAFTVAKLAPEGDMALDLLGSYLRHNRADVRRAALHALGQFATPGQEKAIKAARLLLEDWDAKVRTEAMKVLAQLVPDGHENLGIVSGSAHRTVLAGSTCRSSSLRPSQSALQLSGFNVVGRPGPGLPTSTGDLVERRRDWQECRAWLGAPVHQAKPSYSAGSLKAGRGFADLILLDAPPAAC